MLGHVDVSAGKDKFPIGIANCGDRGNHLLLEGLIGYVLVQLCNADVMLIRKQSETIQQLLAGDEDKIGCYRRAEKVASAGRGCPRVIERSRKGRARVKPLGILQV